MGAKQWMLKSHRRCRNKIVSTLDIDAITLRFRNQCRKLVVSSPILSTAFDIKNDIELTSREEFLTEDKT